MTSAGCGGVLHVQDPLVISVGGKPWQGGLACSQCDAPLWQKWTAAAHFTHHAHTASLSAVAVNSRFVVTGSKDETIHIYDMKKKIEHGALVHHNGENAALLTVPYRVTSG